MLRRLRLCSNVYSNTRYHMGHVLLIYTREPESPRHFTIGEEYSHLTIEVGRHHPHAVGLLGDLLVVEVIGNFGDVGGAGKRTGVAGDDPRAAIIRLTAHFRYPHRQPPHLLRVVVAFDKTDIDERVERYAAIAQRVADRAKLSNGH